MRNAIVHHLLTNAGPSFPNWDQPPFWVIPPTCKPGMRLYGVEYLFAQFGSPVLAMLPPCFFCAPPYWWGMRQKNPNPTTTSTKQTNKQTSLLWNQDSRHFTGQKTYINCYESLAVHTLWSGPFWPWRKAAIVYLLKWEIPLKTPNVCHPTLWKWPGSSMYQGKLCHWFQQLRNFLCDPFFLHLIHSNKFHKPLGEWNPLKSALKLSMITLWSGFEVLNNNMKQRFNLS